MSTLSNSVETDFDAKTTNEYATINKIDVTKKDESIKIKDSLIKKRVEPIY